VATNFDMKAFNQNLIQEFRANEGKVGGRFEGRPVLLLTTTGAKSGRPFTIPLVYLPDGERLLIFASKAGAPRHPDWYHNLVANPTVTLEVGNEKFDATAKVVTGDERDRLYQRQVEAMPQFGDYQKNTTRVIPVVALERQRTA
jgi:deazaflavin-dependent oxidoreductase (nitroreductase family)